MKISKNNTSILLYFLLLSNSIVCIYGSNTISTLVIGTFIIYLFCKDLEQFPYKFHLYQIILLYFYYSLVIAHNYNKLIHEYEMYYISYIIYVLGFLCFIIGYHVINYKTGIIKEIPKQNYIMFIYAIFLIIINIMPLIEQQEATSYRTRFLTYSETRNLPIFEIGLNSIINYFKQMVIFLLNNPIFYAITQFINGFITYLGTGGKLGLLSGIFMCGLLFQVFYKKIKNINMIVIIFFGIIFSILLIGTTGFRGNLGMAGFITFISSPDLVRNATQFLLYFLRSPESNHIIYLSHIIEMIDYGTIDYRYGFDYYRFFLYPIRDMFDNFELASYNQYPVIINNKFVSIGLYLGLTSEIFWNFGWLFPVFLFFHGYLLKKFTNFGFSGNLLKFIVYILFFDRVLLHYVRGQFNTILMHIVFFLIGGISFLFIYRCYKLLPGQLKNLFIKIIPKKPHS